ncbi:MAG TPA: S8 family serine peptidase [Actinocatenispora sp.]
MTMRSARRASWRWAWWFPVLLGVVSLGATLAPAPASADTLRAKQWWVDALKIPAAQRLSTGRGVMVAVIDSGVDAGNPDLAGRVSGGTSTLVGDPNAEIDKDGHGTAMATDIGAAGGNGRPVGVAPAVRIMPVRTDPSSVADTVTGIRYAVDHGAQVINISQGGRGQALPEEVAALRYAMAHDVVVVAASGNADDGVADVITPANVPGVVAVNGVDNAMRFWSGSSYGPESVLSAPATDMVSAWSRQAHAQGSYRLADGTSDAAAIVAGVAALVRSRYPRMSAANVINRLIRTANDPDGAGRSERYGFGIVDPVRALTADVPTVERNPLLPKAEPSPSTQDSEAAANTGGSPLPWIIAAVAALVVVLLVLPLALRRRARRDRPRR